MSLRWLLRCAQSIRSSGRRRSVSRESSTQAPFYFTLINDTAETQTGQLVFDPDMVSGAKSPAERAITIQLAPGQVQVIQCPDPRVIF